MKRKINTSFTSIPPSPVTTKIILDLRGSVTNNTDTAKTFETSFFMDEKLLFKTTIPALSPGKAAGVYHRLPTAGHAGNRNFTFRVNDGTVETVCTEIIRIIESDQRSPKILGGAWNGIYHWSEEEGRLWNKDIKTMTDEDWREQVRGMHALGLNIIVIQETFRNQEYYGKHDMESNGYHGKAYYPSKLYSGRMELAANDPLEAILSEADNLGMKVFPGVGLYAWFDYSPHSLVWHKALAKELFEMYGHHMSFYGFYISEEKAGDLDNTEKSKVEIVEFFRQFKDFCREMAPDKPIMLAPNCWFVFRAVDTWPKLLKNLDILCPFAFHRMHESDLNPESVADLFQKLCDESECHLWMDMECFLFTEDMALYPRPISGLIEDMLRFPNFEKILGYQYQGLLCAPDAKIKLGGGDAMKLYEDYHNYYQHHNI